MVRTHVHGSLLQYMVSMVDGFGNLDQCKDLLRGRDTQKQNLQTWISVNGKNPCTWLSAKVHGDNGNLLRKPLERKKWILKNLKKKQVTMDS